MRFSATTITPWRASSGPTSASRCSRLQGRDHAREIHARQKSEAARRHLSGQIVALDNAILANAAAMGELSQNVTQHLAGATEPACWRRTARGRSGAQDLSQLKAVYPRWHLPESEVSAAKARHSIPPSRVPPRVT